LASKDYYDTLGVQKGATQDQIKSAYRDLVLKFHPDRNKDPKAHTKMQEINEAYAVLSDPQKRQQYDTYGPDQFGKVFTQEDIFRGFDINDVLRQFDMAGFENLFNMAGFGGFQSTRRMDVGSDILERMEITQREASQGVDKRIRVPHTKLCQECRGTGAEKGSKTVTCEECGGKGRLSKTVRIPFGVMETVTTCARCGGMGKRMEKLCKNCHGHGRIQVVDNIVMKVPKNITSGSRLRLAGLGDYGVDRTGDLYVDIFIKGDRDNRRFGVF
jgi:molecular chaperone DnaJ